MFYSLFHCEDWSKDVSSKNSKMNTTYSKKHCQDRVGSITKSEDKMNSMGSGLNNLNSNGVRLYRKKMLMNIMQSFSYYQGKA